MKIIPIWFFAGIIASAVPSGVAAQEDAAAQPAAPAAKQGARHFHTLVRLAAANDNVSVRIPRKSGYEPAVVGRYYPHGTSFKVAASEAAPVVFEFGPESFLKVEGEAEFSVRDVPVDEKSRTVLLSSGSVRVILPRTLPTGLFSVSYPDFTAKDLAGESRHGLETTGDGNEASVHVITGMLALDGRHYKVARMGAADRLRIRTTGGALFTSLRGEAGDCKVLLDQGISEYRDPVSGEKKSQVRTLEYGLTPRCAIKIFRKRSSVGGRMAVSVMTFDAAGEMRNRYTFAENASNLNFGEEVVRVQDISFKTKSGEKAAAEKKRDSGDAPSSGGQGEESAFGGSPSTSSSEDSSSGSADSTFGSF